VRLSTPASLALVRAAPRNGTALFLGIVRGLAAPWKLRFRSALTLFWCLATLPLTPNPCVASPSGSVWSSRLPLRALNAVVAALEAAGIGFIDDDRGDGVVKLRKVPLG
jgi:hypothetical protein